MLHSDNGGEFVNEIIQAIATCFHIKLVHGGPYQPQQQVCTNSNLKIGANNKQGIVEKLNDTIKDGLSKKMQQYNTRY